MTKWNGLKGILQQAFERVLGFAPTLDEIRLIGEPTIYGRELHAAVRIGDCVWFATVSIPGGCRVVLSQITGNENVIEL